MKMMAAEVRRLAPVYYLQTPDFAFPVEPHFRTVGFHWLPEQARAALIQRRGFGFRKKAASVEEAVTNIQSVNLLTKGQMRSEEHTSELQSLMRISYAVFCLKKKK